MRIDIQPFNGEIPKSGPKYLPKNYAQSARNAWLKRGRLEPSPQPLDTGVDLLISSSSFYWYNREANGGDGFWLEFDEDVNVVKGQIADDSFGRYYFTGDGVPKFSGADVITSGGGPYPGTVYDLGIPAPGALTADGPDGDPPDGIQSIDTAYVVTYVSKYGEEGPPGSPSNIVTRFDSGTVELTGIPVPSGNFVLLTKRIYRIEITGVYQFVAEIPASQTTYSDSIDSNGLGEPVPSDGWVAPNANMIGLTALPNGIMMGWWGNTLAFSEAYQPHAWPLAYRYALDYDIVGAAVTATGILVATKGQPYFFSGTNPSSMGQTKHDVSQPCLSKHSVVDMGSYVFYAGSDGIVASGGAEPKVISGGHITAEQWKALNPSSMRATRWDERYLVFYNNGSAGSFTWHPDEGFIFYTFTADSLWYDIETGDVYLRQGTSLALWSEGASSSYTWRSKIFTISPSRLPGVCRVDAENYPVTFRFYADGNLVKTLSVPDDNAFRLPTINRYREFEFELEGEEIVNSVAIADSMSEVS